ncbi:MAG: V-type ATP synthase subunit D [Planctomycetes bacterium]|nr:V-type ATP synthase subunit D [Planctomycetota bacterium]
MAKLKVAPTKSSYLALRRQLAFAQEGYDLLEQKRQILVFELMSRLSRARQAERRAAGAMEGAFGALREALLDIGSEAIDRAAIAVLPGYKLHIDDQALMGLRVPKVAVELEPPSVHYGVGGTSARTDEALRRFTETLALLAELAEFENAVLRLALELRKTQRRCNALSKVFIPDYSETIGYILSSLEERERESFVILRMVKDRLARASEPLSARDGAADEGSAGHA